MSYESMTNDEIASITQVLIDLQEWLEPLLIDNEMSEHVNTELDKVCKPLQEERLRRFGVDIED